MAQRLFYPFSILKHIVITVFTLNSKTDCKSKCLKYMHFG